MANTSFTGPVISANGFEGDTTGDVTGNVTGTINYGTSGTAIASAAAENISGFYVDSSATTGDTRIHYSRLTFSSTGSGETARFLTRVTGANAATGGTVNGAHISLSINGSGTISGAGNALRVTLGGTSTAPGGTIASLQLDSDFASGGAWTGASFIRCTNSGTGTIGNFARLPDAMYVAHVAADSTHSIKCVDASGTAYYILATTVAP